MLLFFLAMSMYPEAQAKAQTQLDEVVGNDRLPEYSDLVNLPYIQAVVKELLRWQPVVPTGTPTFIASDKIRLIVTIASPHKMSSDEMFRGYYIPKDSIIIGNSWYVINLFFCIGMTVLMNTLGQSFTTKVHTLNRSHFVQNDSSKQTVV